MGVEYLQDKNGVLGKVLKMEYLGENVYLDELDDKTTERCSEPKVYRSLLNRKQQLMEEV